MPEEELVLQFTEERSLITLGWVSSLHLLHILLIIDYQGYFFPVDTHAALQSCELY
jgi:hypothetical protein